MPKFDAFLLCVENVKSFVFFAFAVYLDIALVAYATEPIYCLFSQSVGVLPVISLNLFWKCARFLKPQCSAMVSLLQSGLATSMRCASFIRSLASHSL